MEAIILFLIGIILIIFNTKAVIKEKNSFRNQLDSKKKSTNLTDIEIGKIRKEFGETIFELQKQIESLKRSVNAENNKLDQKKDLKEDTLKFENYNNVKIDEIKKMIDKNISIDDISHKTGIGKGELLLIKDLYIR